MLLGAADMSAASPQEFDRQVTAVLQSYRDKLTERTANHMGYPYNLVICTTATAAPSRSSHFGPRSNSHDLQRVFRCREHD